MVLSLAETGLCGAEARSHYYCDMNGSTCTSGDRSKLTIIMVAVGDQAQVQTGNYHLQRDQPLTRYSKLPRDSQKDESGKSRLG